MRIGDWSSDVCSSDLTTLSETTFGRASAADGVILGPVSTADYPPPAQGGLNPSAEFRRRLDLYANIRPSRTRPGVRSLAASMDLVIVRENTEGFYADRTMHLGPGEFMPTPDLAIAMRRSDEPTSEIQSLMRISYADFCLKQKQRKKQKEH